MLSTVEDPSPKRNRSTILYACLLAGSVVTFLLVDWIGKLIVPLRTASPKIVTATASHTFLHLLIALLAILLASRVLAWVCTRIHQPPVVGEILAGICLGPSLLGHFAPDAQSFILPSNVAPHLGTLSQIGVVLFMFLVGLELDGGQLRSSSRATTAISHASIIAPFTMGSIAAIWLYTPLAGEHVSFTVFALFVGVSLSVTAFPVLARILSDRGLQRTPMGAMALACAAVDDLTAWCLLSIVVGVAKANAWEAAVTCGLSAGYVLLVLKFARPAIVRWVETQSETIEPPRSAVPAVLLALLFSALITEAIGIHAIFGSFLLGAIIPHDSRLAKSLKARFEDLVLVLFIPAFFAFTGMRTQIGLVSGAREWLLCALIIAIACLGKFGGSYLAGRAVGLRSRDAASIGVLMNTRGLMELIVLNLGLDLGVISPTLFAMMVIMALVTTWLTTPLLSLTQRLGAPEEGDPLLVSAPTT